MYQKVNFLFHKRYVVGSQKNHLNEIILLSTQNICLIRWVRNYLQYYALIFCLFKPMIMGHVNFIVLINICMLGNISCFCCLLTFQKKNYKKFFQEHQSVKQFGLRLETTFCQSPSGSKQSAEIISRRHQLPLSRKELLWIESFISNKSQTIY